MNVLDEVLVSYPSMKTLPPALLDELFAGCEIAEFKEGSTLLCERDFCHSIFFTVSGIKRIYRTWENGREITLYEVGAGELCPLNALSLFSEQKYPATAVALSDVQLVGVQGERFCRLIGENKDLMRFIFFNMYQDMSMLMELLSEVAFGRLNERLRSYLVKKAEGGVVNATHQQIANDLGTAREVVSRLLKDFERKGMITLARSSVAIHDIDT